MTLIHKRIMTYNTFSSDNTILRRCRGTLETGTWDSLPPETLSPDLFQNQSAYLVLYCMNVIIYLFELIAIDRDVSSEQIDRFLHFRIRRESYHTTRGSGIESRGLATMISISHYLKYISCCYLGGLRRCEGRTGWRERIDAMCEGNGNTARKRCRSCCLRCLIPFRST